MTAYGRRGHFATLLSETPTKKHTPYSKFKDAARDGTRDITRRPRAVQRNVGFVVRIRPKCKHSATATIISRRLRAEASRRSLTIDAPGLPPHRRPTVHRLIGRITQVVDALGDEECLDWKVLPRLNTGDINAIPGLVVTDRQALVHAVNTMTMITTWSPAVHRYFPRDEREAIVATLLELKKAGLPNDVIVGHVLPSTFAPPWNDVFAENEEAREEARNALKFN